MRGSRIEGGGDARERPFTPKSLILGTLIMLAAFLLRLPDTSPAVALSDGLFTSGALLLSLYLLGLVSAKGAFDAFSYSLRTLLCGRACAPDYASYRERPRKSPRRSHLFTGLLFLAASFPISILTLGG